MYNMYYKHYPPLFCNIVGGTQSRIWFPITNYNNANLQSI
jgi:hypothetical protein